MPTTYTDLIADIRKRTKPVSLEEIKRRLEAHEKMTLVDVREKDEWRGGYIPGAVSIPRGFLEIQAEQENLALQQARLSRLAHLGQQDVARVAFDLVLAEVAHSSFLFI